MEVPRGPFRVLKNIVLASASPRRQFLLSNLGIYFEVIRSNVKEKHSGETPLKLVLENARAKVKDILNRKIKGVIIGADTTVVLGDRIIGKPRDREHGLSILRELMGKWHEVYTGCYIVDNTSSKVMIEHFVVKTEVLMDRFDCDIIERYLDTKEPMDKAGAYAIQGVGSFLVREIRGSYTNVIGLPINELTRCLLKLSAIGV